MQDNKVLNKYKNVKVYAYDASSQVRYCVRLHISHFRIKFDKLHLKGLERLRAALTAI